MKNYIGLAVTGHDPAIAIIDKHGQLVFAEAAERRLQLKRAWGCPPDHLNYVQDLVEQYCDPSLDTVVGLTWGKGVAFDLSVVLKLINYKLRSAHPSGREWLTQMKFALLAHKAVMDCATSGLQQAFGKTPMKIQRAHFSHHRTHAVAAAVASPYKEGVCLVMDGGGQASSIAAFDYRDGKLTQIPGVKAFPASLGVFYSLICDMCGFDSLKGEEWKVMGLAAYGKFDQKLYDLIRPLITVKGLRLKASRDTLKIYRKLHDMRRMDGVPALEYADVAATAQIVFTDIVHQMAKNLYDLHISENLIFSGGCALNSSANGTIVENTPFKDVFVGSAPADDGNAIGAAYGAYWVDHPTFKRGDGVLTPYLGSSIKASSLAKLRKYGGFRSQELDDVTLVRTVAQALADGKLVGWAQGRAEFGPRALGNRSILADPRSKDVKERLNAEVKFREEFRPFAPSVLHEFGDEYFVNYQFSPYMERTLRFKEAVKAKVPGVVHVDGTGRLQSVTRKTNPLYYSLIKAFHDITGIPILLNTSFNVMGKPIIHGVEDAVGVFQCSGLDVLVIDNTVFFKETSYQPARSMVGEEAMAV
ncbi:MAG TPA: carbamoyltransferase C-terminal domain-containing protein [Thermoanaerobaculia bacterium]|nr:carbamoyltransferase C-terminal domain-containing protein [Thermoanaerobaculia bacterium]